MSFLLFMQLLFGQPIEGAYGIMRYDPFPYHHIDMRFDGDECTLYLVEEIPNGRNVINRTIDRAKCPEINSEFPISITPTE
jgi:hypothetical protein